MKNKEKIYLFLLCTLCKLPLMGLTFNGEQLEDKISAYNRYYDTHYQELIYLHADKSHYLSGEQIRFKAYCLDKSTSKLSLLSKVAYVEVLDETNTPIMQAKIELMDGAGHGEVFIPTNVSSGNFVLRGYTRWMRNDGPDTFFHSIITIINPFKRLGLSPLANENDISIRFFPESEKLINGIWSNVVYDCRDSKGNPCTTTGKLFANDSLLIAELSPTETGMGIFEFEPVFGQNYSVEFQHNDGTRSQHAFVPVVQKGLSFQVNKQQNGHSLDIFCNDPEIAGASDELYYLIHRNGKIFAGDHIRLERGIVNVQIDHLSLEPGISSITLFSEDGRFLGQRHLFTAPGQNEELLHVSKNTWTPREKASFDVLTSTLGDDTEVADFSISVGSNKKGAGIPRLGLDKYLLIGNVLNAQSYRVAEIFDGPFEHISSSINQLLIAYPKVDTIWQSKTLVEQEYVPEYRAHLITGKITNKLTKETAKGISAYLSVVGKHVQFNSAMSKLDGSLIFEMENFYGPKEIVLMADHTKDSLYSISIEDPFSSEFADIEIPVFDLDEELASWIKDQSQWMQVRNAYKRYEPESPIQQIDSTAFYGEPDARYYLDDFTRFIVMEEVMREYVAGVNVRKNKDGFHFMVLDIDRNEIFNKNPLMLLDGIPVFDADDIIALDPLKIQKIETIKRRYHKGFLDCHGIVSYTSYKGDLSGYELNDDALVIKYQGLQKTNPHYAITYTSEFEKRAATPDFRNVLLWGTDHRSIPLENKSIEFYTSDATDTYQIFVNVLTKDGKAYSASKHFRVISHKEN